jgi:hypothetical protein
MRSGLQVNQDGRLRLTRARSGHLVIGPEESYSE